MTDTQAPSLAARRSLTDPAAPGDMTGAARPIVATIAPPPTHPPTPAWMAATPAPAGKETAPPVVLWPRTLPAPLTDAAPLPRPGRYGGADRMAELTLRLDAEGAGVVSGDLFRLGERERTWTVSFKSAPGAVLAGGIAIPLIAEDRFGAHSEGEITLTATSAGLLADIVFTAKLDGMPFNRPIMMALEHEGNALRTLGLEVETEEGVAPLPATAINGRQYTMESVFAAAGYEIEQAGRNDVVPVAPEEGWSEKQLDTLMHDLAQSDLNASGFALRMLWLSRSNRRGLLGVMFDHRDALPRQGFAVFAGAIAERVPAGRRDTKLLQTAVHEAGHALNLAHRFEREVGRADSLSPMNYDWRYRGGQRVEQFWRDFRFAFDPDEVAFLRHGPLSAVTPGGDPFHSARYWADGDGGYSPYLPEHPLPGWELGLLPPVAGPVFEFAQQVILGVRLVNRTGSPQALPEFLLDVKAGFLEIMIERERMGRRRLAPHAFHPVAHRCFDLDDRRSIVTLPPSGALEQNLQLSFGSAGFAFAEPGSYRVTAVLRLPERDQRFERIAMSEPLRLRVAPPRTVEEDREALDLLDWDAGVYLGSGGAGWLARTGERLLEIAERRLHKKATVRDPVAAGILRAAGFDALRPYYRLHDGRVIRCAPDPKRALAYLSRLDAKSLGCFDIITQDSTTAFIAGLAKA
ncbi:MAG: acetyltransferase [Pseudomonadota bacterium]